MSQRTLLYLIGAPGSGKSTLMRALTAPYDRTTLPKPATQPASPYVPADVLSRRGDVFGYEIGRRRADFSGTDALGMAVIEQAIPWLKAVAPSEPIVLAEGARLANRRFITYALSQGYRVRLGFLDHPDTEAWRTAREERLGKAQQPKWVKGRATAAANLAAWAEELVAVQRIRVLRGTPEQVRIGMEMYLP